MKTLVYAELSDSNLNAASKEIIKFSASKFGAENTIKIKGAESDDMFSYLYSEKKMCKDII